MLDRFCFLGRSRHLTYALGSLRQENTSHYEINPYENGGNTHVRSIKETPDDPTSKQ